MQISGVCGLRAERAFEGKSTVSQGKHPAPLRSAVECCHWKELPGASPLCSAPEDIMSSADAASASFPNAAVGLLQTGNCTPSIP